MFLHLFIDNQKVGVIKQDVLFREDSESFSGFGVGESIQLNKNQYKIVNFEENKSEQQPGNNLLLERI